MNMVSAALYLMAKTPVAGRVKTRMRPQLTAEQCAQLARLMLAQTAAAARRHWPGEVTLCVSPDPNHPAIQQLARQHDMATAAQHGGDLGARMLAALQQGIVDAGAANGAAVMGCDVPHCPGEILAAAHAMLMRGKNPLGPAADGGFYLLGLHRAEEKLFDGIRWDEEKPLAALRSRALQVGIDLSDLPALRDIDRYADLQWLAARDHAYQRFIH